MAKKIKIIFVILILSLFIVSCKTADILSGEDAPDKDWEWIESSAANTTVNIYTTVIDEEMKSWLSGKFSKTIKEKHNIYLNVKKLDFVDIISLFENDILHEVKNGQIDLIILRDDEFTILKEKSFLYSEITNKMPNFKTNVNLLDLEVSTEHGTPLDGFASPFSKEQFVLMFDEDVLETYPHSTDELLEFLKENKKTFTYPNPLKEKVGGEFIRTVIYEIIGEDKLLEIFSTAEMLSTDILYDTIKPALDYLIELDKYILKDSGAYFSRLDDIDYLFTEGELYFTMSSDFAYPEDAIKVEKYPDGAKSFIFDLGTIGDTIFVAVPINASNKSGAIVTINEMLSVDMQVFKYNPKEWGTLPAIDINILSETNADKFKKMGVKRNTLRVEELFEARYPEFNIDIQNSINELWDQYVNN